MLRPFASITHQGSHVKGDILPGVRSVASGHSLTFPKKRAHKMKVSADECPTEHWAKKDNMRLTKAKVGRGLFLSFCIWQTLCSQILGG